MVCDVRMIHAKQCILQFGNLCHISIIFQVVVKEGVQLQRISNRCTETIVLAVETWLLHSSSDNQVNLSSRSLLTQ